MGVDRVTAVVGGLALIAGSFLDWVEIAIGDLTRTGFDLELAVFFNWDEVGLADSFILSAGIATSMLGILAVVGASISRWPLVRMVGFVAVAAAVLLWLSLANTSDMLLGYWVVAGGALLTALSSFLPGRAPASA